MASGHMNRANRPNTWLHRPACKREEKPCQLGAVLGPRESDLSAQIGPKQRLIRSTVKHWFYRCSALAPPSDTSWPRSAVRIAGLGGDAIWVRGCETWRRRLCWRRSRGRSCERRAKRRPRPYCAEKRTSGPPIDAAEKAISELAGKSGDTVVTR